VELSGLVRRARFSPPDGAIVGTVAHLRQFLLNLHQPAFPHFRSRPLDRTVVALLRIQNVAISQVDDFVTEAGEALRKISHNSSIRLKPVSV